MAQLRDHDGVQSIEGLKASIRTSGVRVPLEARLDGEDIAHAKRTPCSYCGSAFTIVCDADTYRTCGNYRATIQGPAPYRKTEHGNV